MSVENKQVQQCYNFPPMPPENPALQEAFVRQKTTERKAKRAKVWSRVGAAAIALLGVSQPINAIDGIVTSIKYPDTQLEVALVDGAKDMPDGGLMYIAFPGAGQKSSKNAATELFNAGQGQFKVAYVTLPNQGFTIDQLAQKTESLIAETEPNELGVEGVSMGTKLGFATLSAVQDNANRTYYRKVIDDLPLDFSNIERKLPEVSYFLALSSPNDLDTAKQGELVQGVSGVLKIFDIQPGMRVKFVYCMLNSQEDVYDTLNIRNPKAWATHIWDSLAETWNDTPPAMVRDQLLILASGTNQAELNKVVSPGITQFIYYYPGNGTDKVVDNNQAYRQFVVALEKLEVKTAYEPTDSTEHADTVAAANAFGQHIKAENEQLAANQISLIYTVPK